MGRLACEQRELVLSRLGRWIRLLWRWLVIDFHGAFRTDPNGQRCGPRIPALAHPEFPCEAKLRTGTQTPPVRDMRGSAAKASRASNRFRFASAHYRP